MTIEPRHQWMMPGAIAMKPPNKPLKLRPPAAPAAYRRTVGRTETEPRLFMPWVRTEGLTLQGFDDAKGWKRIPAEGSRTSLA
jgi:hypothetical protein